MNFYLTADKVGAASGGGVVTANESRALAELGPCEVWGREQLEDSPQVQNGEEPWRWDLAALWMPKSRESQAVVRLCHVYAGTFSSTVAALKNWGVKVTYTAAAHDVSESRREHERFGFPFRTAYPHLCEPRQWDRYVHGYLDADVLVCPSNYSADVMRRFGAKNRIEVIPHGVDLPKCKNPTCEGRGRWVEGGRNWECWYCNGSGIAPIAPLPEQFRVGYLGSYGPDKGVLYLLQAWAKLDLKDATLVLGGRDSTSPFVENLIVVTGARNVVRTGWVNNVSDFYNSLSLYVQSSVTEGFGCEVLEAMAHGRAVLCSEGAGAADLVPESRRFPARNVEELGRLINGEKKALAYYWNDDQKRQVQNAFREIAEKYTWDKIRARYQKLWREVIDGQVPQAAGGD